MDYVYGAVWLIIALLLIFKMSKENKIFYFLGGYFVFMGAWWIINPLVPSVNMFDGVPGWIFRGVSAVVIIIVAVFYYKTIYKQRKK